MRRLIDLLALVGLLFLGLLGYAYLQGWQVVSQLDPKASQVFSEFAHKALSKDVASANIVKRPLDPGVTRKAAIRSMKLRANQRNIKLVGRLAYHRQIRAMTGEPYPYLEILQFCDPLTARDLLAYNPDFVVYMPCSIVLYEDGEGRYWLATMNLDMLIHGGPQLAPDLRERVQGVKDGLLDIMAAGASGSL